MKTILVLCMLTAAACNRPNTQALGYGMQSYGNSLQQRPRTHVTCTQVSPGWTDCYGR